VITRGCFASNKHFAEFFDLHPRIIINCIHNSMTKNITAGKIPAYKNSRLPAATRVKDLLSRMTLAGKAAQMMCVWQEKARKLVDAEGNFDYSKAKTAFKQGHGLGQVGRPSDAGAPATAPWLGRTAR
jgi:hypothetical protein